MSEVIEVEEHDELLDLIDTEDTVVVRFTAVWCGPCKQYGPHFHAASERSDATFVDVDVDKADWAMAEYDVRSVPTTKVFKGGQYVSDIAKTPSERTTIKLLSAIESA